MPRPSRRSLRRWVYLPEDLVIRVELELFNMTQGRVPYAAWSRLVESLLRERLTALNEYREGQALASSPGPEPTPAEDIPC